MVSAAVALRHLYPLVLLALGAALPSGALAASYDPALTWRTVHSPRFAVHYHDGGYNLAVRVARIAEEVVDDVAELFGNMPEGRIDIVLVDSQDDANGSAGTQPKNTLRLYLAAPTELTGLSYYEEWLRILLIHEIAHLCDIDQAHGVAKVLRAIFGRSVSWNGYSPHFLSEGVAVYAETVLTRTGRGRSSFVAMLLRTAALDGTFLDIDQANVANSEWPGPNGAYFYGGLFHLWLRQKYGDARVRELHQAYASTLVPFIYYPAAKELFGKSLPDLWQDFAADELALALEIQDNVRRAGETASRRLTFHGRNITGARYSPDGSFIIYSRASPVDGSTVRRIDRDGKNDRFLVLDTYSPRSSFTADGRSFYFSQSAINNRFNDFNDLYRYELDSDEMVRLRDHDDPDGSLRARDPDVSPDGKRLVFVQNHLHQSWVSIGTLVGEDRDELEVRVLVPPSGDTQHASPRFSPDGKLVAISTWFDGGKRDIVLVDAETGALVRRVTHDEAMEGNPAFSPDGRYVLYESDADGISNLYAYDRVGNRYFRLTRVVGGAFQPDVSRDGKWLLFRNASGIGFDIHELPFDPASWLPLAYEPRQGYLEQAPVLASAPAAGEPTQATLAPEGTAPTSAAGGAADEAWAFAALPEPLPREAEPKAPLVDLTDEPYSPWRTLLPFQDNWVLYPVPYTLNGEPVLDFYTFGADTLAHHIYAVRAGTGFNTRQLNWDFSYAYNAWYPTVVAAIGDSHVGFGSDDRGNWIAERRRRMALSVDWPMLERHFVGLSYVFRRSTPVDEPSASYLASHDAAYVEAGYYYSRARSFPYSVSPEHGHGISLSTRWYGEGLGGDFDELLVKLDGRLYLNNPLFDNHVLVLRTTGSLALGPEFGQRFILGGSQASSLLTVQTDDIYPLRGFPIDLDAYPSRTGLVAAYAEYRLPLWHIERGLWTLPIFFERMHAALFADSGTTFGDGSEEGAREVLERAQGRLRGGRVGVGGELRLTAVLGWFAPFTFTAGMGFPIVDHGRYDGLVWDERVIYINLGTSL